MRIFASWSGAASRDIASIFKEWLPCVLQDLEVYVSAQDIASGERWLGNVNSNLQEHSYGISIVTEANSVSPWILYEAGAIAKSLNGRLIPILCGIGGIAITNHPLTQFQYIKAPEKGELYRLVSDLNSARENKLPDERLKSTFEKWYPDFLAQYEKVSFDKAAVAKAEGSIPATIIPVLELLMREMRDIRSDLSEMKSQSYPFDSRRVGGLPSHFNVPNPAFNGGSFSVIDGQPIGLMTPIPVGMPTNSGGILSRGYDVGPFSDSMLDPDPNPTSGRGKKR
ncbi:TIR domain-containing protein [Neorhizobium galegae]|uniref:TIR domain-containing protein n=1 Tax=Neorhizobium galegae TaxID=399 RepID=UPI0006214B03|nr:TIR domain-containing protein [Neorhizobium galegae]KAB1126310.1 TIR domain-containing protein [Neorhizobium galegae]MCQ1805282.1 TIR domain-containing protein [Neorhizobium galegae]CDZ56043.1 HPr serine kinase domain protein [Neorhizobium galegae bv. orientalis]